MLGMGENMKFIVILLSLGFMLVGCAKPSEETPVPVPISKLKNLTLDFNNGEIVSLDRSYGTIAPNSYDYSFTCKNCTVGGKSYAAYGCSSRGSYQDLNPGSNRGKACFRVEYTTCSHNYKGLIVSYEYSIINNYAGIHVTTINETLWDKDCNF